MRRLLSSGETLPEQTQKRVEARTSLQAALSPEMHDISAAISACEKDANG